MFSASPRLLIFLSLFAWCGCSPSGSSQCQKDNTATYRVEAVLDALDPPFIFRVAAQTPGDFDTVSVGVPTANGSFEAEVLVEILVDDSSVPGRVTTGDWCIGMWDDIVVNACTTPEFIAGRICAVNGPSDQLE